MCRTLTHASCWRNGKDGVGNLCTALPISGQWEINIEPGKHRTMTQEIRSVSENPHEE